MELSLAPEVKKMIEQSVQSGEFGTAEEVVTAAIKLWRDHHAAGDFAPGELDKLIADGERSGSPALYEEFRANIQMHRRDHKLRSR